MGPLASVEQRGQVAAGVARLAEAAEVVTPTKVEVRGADAETGAFFAPTELVARDAAHPAVPEVEAFGPVCTVVPYADIDEAVHLAALGRGSLVASVFTPDSGEARALTMGLTAPNRQGPQRLRSVRGSTSGG